MLTMIHGNYANYISGRCRCELCRAAHRRELKRWRCQGPRHAMTDAAAAQAHIQALLEAGMSFNAIAKASQYASRNSLTSILSAKRIRVTTEAKILAVTTESDTRGSVYEDATGARRRLQALAFLGYSSRQLAALLDTDHRDIQDIQNGKRPIMRRFRINAVRDLYDQLSMRPGSNTRAAAHARAQGWVPPLAWDEDRIDNPAARTRHGLVRSAA